MLKGGEGLAIEDLRVNDNLKSFISKMNYSEEQTAMFLLGTLIGEIGNVQYKKNEGNKPILNKLNFNGIDKSKFIRLTKDVFNKLNQEKIRTFNEVTFFEMKRLMDKNIETWSLNKEENLFYILSGYSFATTLPMLKGIKMNNSEILYIYDAKLTNPNGDPDEENRPRMDYERDINLVSDSRLKRYIRDYMLQEGFDIFVRG